MDLVPHPDSRWSPWWVTADVLRAGVSVHLTFRIEGDLDQLFLPQPAPPERTDELWRTTCVEWFVTEPLGTGYTEFNFSPSGQWAAYRFDDSRRGMRDAVVDQPAKVSSFTEAGVLKVTANLRWDCPDAVPFGCSAVLQHLDGRRAYHAPAHPDGNPDFHARACFTGVLGGRDGA